MTQSDCSECSLITLFECSICAFIVISECSLSAPWMIWLVPECSLSALEVNLCQKISTYWDPVRAKKLLTQFICNNAFNCLLLMFKLSLFSFLIHLTTGCPRHCDPKSGHKLLLHRSEILSNMWKNEAGRWLANGQRSGSGGLSMIYRVSQNEFLLKSFTPKTLWLKSGLQGCPSKGINIKLIFSRLM